MRVDELVNFFNSLMPKHSNKFDDFYKNAWRPEDYPVVEQEKKEESKE
jgi:hypothetical protein